jgi:2-keto-myo-inositol isomerase
MPASPHFALNHMVAPSLSSGGLMQLAGSLGLDKIEIRNDLPGVAMQDGTPGSQVRREAEQAGVAILSINALQRFDTWDDGRAAEAGALAAYARDCGAVALVLCPTNAADDPRGDVRRRDDLRTAMRELMPILAACGVRGLVEPLGFAECALRRKRDAADAIEAVGGDSTFRIVHDTFHHFVAMEQEVFPELTGLVHISGVEDPAPAREALRDMHRVLVGPGDTLGNVEQIRRLMRGGYAGPLSFEPFAAEVHALADPAAALRESMAAIRAGLDS